MSAQKDRQVMSAERFFEEPGEAFALADSSGKPVYVVEKKRIRLIVHPVVSSPRQLAARKAVETRRRNESVRKRVRHLAAKKAVETRRKNKEALQ